MQIERIIMHKRANECINREYYAAVGVWGAIVVLMLVTGLVLSHA